VQSGSTACSSITEASTLGFARKGEESTEKTFKEIAEERVMDFELDLIEIGPFSPRIEILATGR